MKRILLVISMFAGLVWIVACSESDCPLNNNPMNTIGFYDSNTGKAMTLGDTLTVTAFETDSVLINRISNAKSLSLPLRYEGGKTSYVFDYTIVLRDTFPRPGKEDSIDITIFHRKDTIGMTYTDEKHFLSMDCGILTYFNLKSIQTTNHLIDSVRIINPAINEIEKTNIEVFFRTAD